MRAHPVLSTLVALALALPCATSRAAADDEAPPPVSPFGLRAANVIVVDHLAGFVHTARIFSGLGGDTSTANLFGVMGVPPISRLGYHRIVAGRVTVGAGVHYADQSSAIGLSGDQSGDQVRSWGVSPRVGYVLPLHRLFSIWLRGGLSYLSSSSPGSNTLGPTGTPQNTPDKSEWHVALGAEAQFVFTPAESVGFTIGPTIEWGVAGKLTEGSQTEQIRWRLYGVTLGLLVDF